MAHFLRILAQFSIIGLIAALPITLPGHGLVLSVFCAIVVGGLLLFGIINPAHAVRRAIVWGGAACISGALGYGDPEPITNALKKAGVPGDFADVLQTLLTFFMNPTINYIAAIALGMLTLLEITTLLLEWLPKRNSPSVSIRPDAGKGKMSIGNDSRIDFGVSVTNRSSSPVTISGSHLKIMRFFERQTELYSEQRGPAEVTSDHPLRIEADDIASFEIIVRNPGRALARTASLFAWRPAIWVVELPASLTFDGDDALPKAATPLRFKLALRTKRHTAPTT